MNTRPDPIFSSEPLAAYRAVRPLLLREQRPWVATLACLLAALVVGLALGHFGARTNASFPAVQGAILGIACGGLFQRIGKPIEHRWRWLAVATACFGLVVNNLTWSYLSTDGWTHPTVVSFIRPGSPRMETTLGFLPLQDIIAFTMAGWSAWFFSYRMPTQGEIIQRARHLAHR